MNATCRLVVQAAPERSQRSGVLPQPYLVLRYLDDGGQQYLSMAVLAYAILARGVGFANGDASASILGYRLRLSEILVKDRCHRQLRSCSRILWAPHRP